MRGFSHKSERGPALSSIEGFTLVELLVVVAIITLLITIGLASYSELMKRSRDTKRETDLKVIQSALQQYYADRGIYPTTLPSSGQLTIDTGKGERAGAPSPVRVYLGNIPTDPMTTPPYCYEAQPATPTACNNNVTTNPKIDCTSYKLFAKLENPPSSTTYTCSSTTYNYMVTSP